MSDYARIHGWVSGHVQGVGFRYFVQDLAVQYNLTGWVRNLYDGRVEFIAEGQKGLLNDFLKDVNRGPVSGFVSGIETNRENFTDEFKNFRIRF